MSAGGAQEANSGQRGGVKDVRITVRAGGGAHEANSKGISLISNLIGDILVDEKINEHWSSVRGGAH